MKRVEILIQFHQRCRILICVLVIFILNTSTPSLANPPDPQRANCLTKILRDILGWTDERTIRKTLKQAVAVGKAVSVASEKAATTIRTMTAEMQDEISKPSGDYLEITLEDKIQMPIQEAQKKFEADLQTARQNRLNLIWIALWKYRIFKGKMLRTESQRAPAALLVDDTISILNDLVVKSSDPNRNIASQVKMIEKWIRDYQKHDKNLNEITTNGFKALFNLIQIKRALIKIKDQNKAGATLTLAKQIYEFHSKNELQKKSKDHPSEYMQELKHSKYHPTEFEQVSYSQKNLEQREKIYLAQVRQYLGPISINIVDDVPVISTQGKNWSQAGELIEAEVKFAHQRNKLDLVYRRLADLEQDLARDQNRRGNTEKLSQIQNILTQIEAAFGNTSRPSETAKLELGRKYFEQELEAWEKSYQHFSTGIKDDVLINFFSKTGKYRGAIEAISGFPFMGWIRHLLSPRYIEIKALGTTITLGSLLYSQIKKLLETKPTPEEICAQEKDFKKFVECVNRFMKERHPEEFEKAKLDSNLKPFFEDDGATMKPEFESEFKVFRETWEKAQQARIEEDEMRKRLVKPAEDYFKIKLGEFHQKSQAKEQAALHEELLKHIGAIPDPDHYNEVILAFLIHQYKEPMHRMQELWTKSNDTRLTEEERTKAREELEKISQPLLSDLQTIIEHRRKTVEAPATPETDAEKQKRNTEALNQIMRELFRQSKSASGTSASDAAAAGVGAGAGGGTGADTSISTPPVNEENKGF